METFSSHKYIKAQTILNHKRSKKTNWNQQQQKSLEKTENFRKISGHPAWQPQIFNLEFCKTGHTHAHDGCTCTISARSQKYADTQKVLQIFLKTFFVSVVAVDAVWHKTLTCCVVALGRQWEKKNQFCKYRMKCERCTESEIFMLPVYI